MNIEFPGAPRRRRRGLYAGRRGSRSSVCSPAGASSHTWRDAPTARETGPDRPTSGPTKAQLGQLVALDRCRAGVSGGEFARVCWPDSPGWRKTCPLGRHAVGLKMAGGKALRRLAAAGWATYSLEDYQLQYTITAEGRSFVR